MLIFVFGSNLQGIHGAGAALHARQFFGAVQGQGKGLQGRSYAIPTKFSPRQRLPLEQIKPHVDVFLEHAFDLKHWFFCVTKIGCGLAGYQDHEIAPMFDGAPGNCYFSNDWAKYLTPNRRR